MVAPMEGTHGENFFFSSGVSGRKMLCQGVSKKECADFGACPATATFLEKIKLSVNLG